MSDTLKIFGTTYTGVTAAKFSDGNYGTLTYIRPTGTKSITANGTGIDVASYASVDVNVSGGGSSGNEFLVILTLDQNDNWVPNKTFSEIQTAYNDGKTIVTVASYTEDEDTYFYQSSCVFDDTGLDPYFGYTVIESHNSQYSDDLWSRSYEMYSDSSNDEYYETVFYNPFDADATSNDVLSGKIFFNYNGSAVGSISQRSSTDLTVSGDTVTVPAGYYATSASKAVSAGTEGTPTATKGAVSNHSVSVTPSVTNSAGYISGGTHSGTAVAVSASELVSGTKSIQFTQNGIGSEDVTNYETVSIEVAVTPSLQAKTGITPTTSSQTIEADSGYDGLSSVQINAMPSGSASTPATTVTANPSISVDSTTGLITATASATKSVTPTVSAGYVSSGTAGTITVSGSNTEQLSTQAAATITPTESEQTAVAAGKYTTGIVKVGAISSTYVGSGINQNDSTDLTASGATVTVPAGYYATAASKSVASGTAGTPTATKGTVSNHQVSVTPSVTNTTGYITGGTKTGIAVTVSASELASGNKAIVDNGTNIDVVGYSTVSVAVPFSAITVSSSNPSGGNNGDVWIKTS